MHQLGYKMQNKVVCFIATRQYYTSCKVMLNNIASIAIWATMLDTILSTEIITKWFNREYYANRQYKLIYRINTMFLGGYSLILECLI